MRMVPSGRSLYAPRPALNPGGCAVDGDEEVRCGRVGNKVCMLTYRLSADACTVRRRCKKHPSDSQGLVF
jgi:hypothetical protein